MFLYVIEMSNSCWWKIGVAKNVTRRLETLQTGNPHRLTVYMVIPLESSKVAYKLEQDLLSLLSFAAGQSGGTEWVNLPQDRLDKAVNTLLHAPRSKKDRLDIANK